jgi:hypothetical protein
MRKAATPKCKATDRSFLPAFTVFQGILTQAQAAAPILVGWGADTKLINAPIKGL